MTAIPRTKGAKIIARKNTIPRNFRLSINRDTERDQDQEGNAGNGEDCRSLHSMPELKKGDRGRVEQITVIL